MDNSINYQIKKHKLDMHKVNMINVISKTRKRQNNRIIRLFKSTKFGEDYNWLNIYS